MRLIKQLIEIESYSGHEQAIQQFIIEWLEHRGLQPQNVMGNTVVKITGQNQKTALVFNVHVDTVQPGSLALWVHHPQQAWSEGQRLFGLGASDEKAGVAMSMLVAQCYSAEQPPCDLWFMFVNEEETTGAGSAQCLGWFKQHQLAQYQLVMGILPEPTNLEQVEIGHKGNAFIKLTVSGQSGHGSEPQAVSINATLVMAEILLKLKTLEKSWEKYANLDLGNPSIAAGTSIKSGDQVSPNKIADTCVATLDIRTTPLLHPDVLTKVKKFLHQYPVKVEYLYPPIPHGYTNPQTPLVQTISHLFPQLKITTTNGSTDLCFFSQYQIPAIIFGPGEKSGIHSPNEYCYPAKIKQGVTMMKKLIMTLGKLANV